MSESPRLYIALYTDQDVTDELAIQLRKQGFNAQSAWEAGMSRAKDDAQLKYAVEHRMTLLTYNVGDFVRLGKEYARKGETHYGIVISTQQFSKKQVGELLHLTLRLLNTYDAEQITNRIVYLQEFK